MVHMYTVPASAAAFPRVGQFQMTYLTNTELNSKSTRPMHSHPEITEIALVYSGHGVHSINHQMYYSEPGDLVIYNADTLHQDMPNSEDGVRHYLCGISGLQIEGQAPGNIFSDPSGFLLKSGVYQDFLLQGFQMLEHDLQVHSSGAAAIAQGFVQTLLAIIFDLNAGTRHMEKETSSGDLPIEDKMRFYIDQNYSQNFSLETLAEEFHVSRYHASHAFSKAFGISPIRYRALRRIGEAQSLLTHTDESITSIASLVGYDDPNQFSQAFTKIVGMPPSKYRDLSVWPPRIRKKD